MVNALADYAGEFSQARDQGRRPTCIAFAVSDGHAHYRKLPKEPLSPEYLFCKAAERQLPAHHYEGVRTVVVAQALAEDGQPFEHHYPYRLDLNAKADLPVPENPFPHPLHRAVLTYETYCPESLGRLLKEGRSILLIAKITESFRKIKSGQAVLRLEQLDIDNDPVAGVHAVLGVGYGLDKAGEPYVKIRNSWGRLWASDGYLWLPMKYLANHLVWMAKFG
jgi:hypothetical protein